MERLNMSITKLYKESAKEIDVLCEEESFYKAGDEMILGVLKEIRNIKSSTLCKIVNGLWNQYGMNSFKFFEEIEINWSECMKSMDKILKPLQGIKFLGRPIFLDLANFYTERKDDLDDGCFDVDWENEFKMAKKEINRLKEEIRYNKEMPDSVDLFLGKIVGSIKQDKYTVAIEKYCDDSKKCSRIIRDVINGRMKIEEREEYSSGDAFIEDKRNFDPLLVGIQKAIEANDCPSVKCLSKGCFLGSHNAICNEDRKCFSLFSYACYSGSYECAMYLLKAGGGLDQRFNDTSTPLISSILIGNYEMAKFLINEGADVNAADKQNRTPLILAAERSSEISKLLIKKGANVKDKDDNNLTPLHLAATKDYLDVVELLIEKGADIDARDDEENTPLFIAVKFGSLNTCKYLIKAGADLSVRNNESQALIHAASMHNNPEVAKLIIENGGDVNDTDKEGHTPLYYCKKYHSYKVEEILEKQTKK